jgi:hypothetical protein
MATTAAGTPYVEASDLVSGYPAVSLALANHIDGLDGGKVLQIVRATDTTARSTTSASYVDASISVTIAPTQSTSKIILAYHASMSYSSVSFTANAYLQITDSSNAGISGAEEMLFRRLRIQPSSSSASLAQAVNLFAFDEPATTAATTYKVRMKTDDSMNLINASCTGQLYAYEVSA